jgi:23S rRNA pseudouridine1911/1915/1917 synthase
LSTEPDKIETVVTLDVPVGYQENERVDVYLTRFLPNVSRAKVQQGVRAGAVTVNGKAIKRPSHALQAGDSIVCKIMRPPPIEAIPEDIPLDIVFEDESIIVVNKPAGMVVHPAYGNRTGTLVNALLHHVGAAPIRFDEDDEDDEEPADDEAIGLSTAFAGPVAEGDVSVRPGIVHRLDKDTSGLLVVAKNDVSHRHLAAQFFERTIRRRYQALVLGEPKERSGTVATQLGRDPRDRKRIAVVPESQGKHAITHYELVEPFGLVSLVEFRLETGRTHQIRVHAAHLGTPVFGDEIYGGRSLTGSGKRRQFLKNMLALMPRQALHAGTLGFAHPIDERWVEFEAPLPPDMSKAITRLREVAGM